MGVFYGKVILDTKSIEGFPGCCSRHPEYPHRLSWRRGFRKTGQMCRMGDPQQSPRLYSFPGICSVLSLCEIRVVLIPRLLLHLHSACRTFGSQLLQECHRLFPNPRLKLRILREQNNLRRFGRTGLVGIQSTQRSLPPCGSASRGNKSSSRSIRRMSPRS